MGIKARERYILIGGDYSQQEPKILAVMTQDEHMIHAASTGQDLYSTVAARAFHTTYEDCLEHFSKDTPIKKDETGHWRYATKEEVEENDFDKRANGETDTYDDGKKRRKQAKVILLGLMYGRGPKALAEQLGSDIDEAKSIMQSVYDAFPKIEQFDNDSKAGLKRTGYTTTLWGRKRRIPEARLPEYEFDFSECPEPFKSNLRWQSERMIDWQKQLKNNYWDIKKKTELKDEWKKDFGAVVKENGALIARAERQTVNARIQGCLDGNVRIQSKEYGFVKLKDYTNKTLTIWDGQKWTPGTIIASGKKQKCVITFNNGQKFICSPDHKFRVINTRGNYTWKKCSELMPQDHISINTNYVPSDFVYNSDQFKSASYVHNANYYHIDDIKNRFEAGRVLGRLASDGSFYLRQESGSTLTQIVAEHEFEIIPELESAMKVWNYKTEYRPVRENRTQQMAYISITSHSLINELVQLDIKHQIHENIFMDTELLRGFISGFFDGDGGISGTNIRLVFGTQYNFEPLLEDLQKALLFYGIRSYIHMYKDRYVLTIKTIDSKKFIKTIGFLNTKKQEKAARLNTILDEHVFGPNLLIKSIEITDDFIDMYDVCNTNNGYFIADGIVTHNSAADMSKKALIAINEDEKLRELGFETLVPIHDEVLGQCPLANARECRDLFTYDMENCAKDRVPLDIKVDPTCVFAWYGEEIDVDELLKDLN